MTIPSRFRQRLLTASEGNIVQTLNPLDRALWLYPLIDWELIESKLAALSDFDKRGRRAKQMMRGYANDCQMDAQGRILIPQELRDYAYLHKQAVIFGQGNKFEVWNQATWEEQRDQWLSQLDDDGGEPSESLKTLSL